MLAPALLALLAIDLPPRPHMTAARVAEAPIVDGRLDDAIWATAPATRDFRQRVPNDGQPSSERTTVRIAYDDEALYVGFDCEQIHTPIAAWLTRRDQDSESDWVWVELDTRGDRKSAYTFAVSAAGVLADGVVHDQTVLNFDWDENWEAAVVRTARGWSAEMKIPVRILRFDPTLPEQRWGMDLVRYIGRTQEQAHWAYAPRTAAGWVVHFGTLDGLTGLSRRGRFELRPYALGRLRWRDADADTTASGFDARGSAGLDLKLHVSEALTLDVAVNPDFGQVEADQVILNLSNYETFLPEKRPLFLEGVEAFSTPQQDQFIYAGPTLVASAMDFPNRIFYSRRIGAPPVRPTLRNQVAVTEQLVEVPSPATIYAAGKLVGRLGGRLTLGALSAATGRSDVAVQDVASGAHSDRLVEPRTVYNVLRLKQELGNGHVGLIGTATNRLEPTGAYPEDPVDPGLRLCPAGASVNPGSRCFHDAYVGGVDSFWRSPGGNYVASGALLGSVTQGGPPRAFLDGTVLQGGDKGAGAWTRLAKEGGHLIAQAEYFGASRALDYNDLGYLPRQNLHEVKSTVSYRTLTPGRLTLDTATGLDYIGRWNASGLDLGQSVGASSRWHLTNLWYAMLGVDFAHRRYDDRELGTGAALERAGYLGARLELSTNPTRAVRGRVFATAQRISGDAFAFSADVSLTASPVPQLEIGVTPQVTYSDGEPRYALRAPQPAGEYLFGRLNAKGASAIVRAAYAFSPRLTLQAYAQLFLGAGHYDRFATAARTGVAGQVIRLADLAPVAGTVNGADFEQGALNVNVVLRWEYRLGSVLYLVYTRAQVPAAARLIGTSAALRLSAIPEAPAVDVVMLKLTYWWAS